MEKQTGCGSARGGAPVPSSGSQRASEMLQIAPYAGSAGDSKKKMLNLPDDPSKLQKTHDRELQNPDDPTKSQKSQGLEEIGRRRREIDGYLQKINGLARVYRSERTGLQGASIDDKTQSRWPLYVATSLFE